MLAHQELPARIIGLAIEVHYIVGPRLLESVCLAREATINLPPYE